MAFGESATFSFLDFADFWHFETFRTFGNFGTSETFRTSRGESVTMTVTSYMLSATSIDGRLPDPPRMSGYAGVRRIHEVLVLMVPRASEVFRIIDSLGFSGFSVLGIYRFRPE